MPKKGENISLTSYDDLFETEESRAESQLERVQNIPVRELVPFKNHPFKVLDDEAMLRTTESICRIRCPDSTDCQTSRSWRISKSFRTPPCSCR